MLQNAPEFNSVGGGFGGWGGFGGGWGAGIAPFGLFGLVGGLGLGRDGFGRDGYGGIGGRDCCEDIKENARNLAVLQAISDNKDQTIAEGRGLAAAICDSQKTNLQQFYAAAIQAANNTQQLSNQISASNVVIDKRFDDLTLAGVNQTAAILARINQVELDQLKEQLLLERRARDLDAIKIENINNNTNIQAQMQQQAQIQTQRDFDNIRRFDSIFGSFNQLNRNTQDIVNLGVMAASGTQANSQNNVR